MGETLKKILSGGDTPRDNALHQIFLALVLAAFGAANGFLALRLAACSYAPLWHPWVYASYYAHPPIVLLNVLPGVVLIFLGYFLTRRPWAAYLISAVPVIGLALVHYYKVQLRGDPFIAADLRLLRTAGGIVGRYHLDLSRVVLVALGGAALMLLFCVLFLKNGLKNRPVRLIGALVFLALIPLLYKFVYMNDDIYYGTVNLDAIENEWSDVEVYVSRGFWYPFMRSVSKAMPTKPADYNAHEAEAFLKQYPDEDIPEGEKVNLVGVMLEAFCDLSDFPSLAAVSGVAELYRPLHELEKESVHGDLLTNIFAGGTVDTEWGFLSGYSRHNSFRAGLDSYVRYFNAQGYQTLYRHPGYGWFYNRRNINDYLGFSENVFSENGFGALVDPETAPKRSDRVLFDYLLSDLDRRGDGDPPLFSFSVTYQNHGPYADDLKEYQAELVTAETGWSEKSRNVLNNYLDGIADTILELRRFTEALEARREPVVLVIFGDHKPWLGNDASVYQEIGVNIDLSSLEGFRNYYATPYLIWANSAAKAVLGEEFSGYGGDFSPCLLMAEVFDRCGWEGPAFMALAREMRGYTPLLHDLDLYIENGVLTDTLSPEAAEFYRHYRQAEYWRETNGWKP